MNIKIDLNFAFIVSTENRVLQLTSLHFLFNKVIRTVDIFLIRHFLISTVTGSGPHDPFYESMSLGSYKISCYVIVFVQNDGIAIYSS